MEEEQRRMQSAVFDTLNDIDRKCLRTLQVNTCVSYCDFNVKTVKSYLECT